MILKTILTSFILLTVYNIFVMYFAPTWWIATQSHLQNNLSRAENFMYDESDTIQNVVVGSSLSRNIITDSLPNTYNLAFAGKGTLDGLNILDKKSKLPRNIFIETNFILKKSSPEFTDLINNPVMYYPRKFIISLREDKQPVAILGLMEIKVLSTIKNTILGKKIHANTSTLNDKDEKSPLFPQLMKMRTKQYSEIPKGNEWKNSLAALKYHISRLKEKGANIIFIEMPVERQLNELPQARFIRNLVKSNFPISDYQYIILPDSLTFQTTDGIHLGTHESLRYTMYFRSKVKNMLGQ
jgi:hypothetical protein